MQFGIEMFQKISSNNVRYLKIAKFQQLNVLSIKYQEFSTVVK